MRDKGYRIPGYEYLGRFPGIQRYLPAVVNCRCIARPVKMPPAYTFTCNSVHDHFTVFWRVGS